MPLTSEIYDVQVTLTGTAPLVLDNIESADPENPIAREIKQITGKDSMTEEDQHRKDWLAYFGALYLDSSKTQLVFPYRAVKRALRSGAYYVGGASLSGKIDNGMECSSIEFPLDYKGPADVRQLFEDPDFRLRLMVNKNPSGKKAMVPSVRPLIPVWSLSFTATIFNSIVGWDNVVRALQFTGKSVGIGNARKLGYGRFSADIIKL